MHFAFLTIPSSGEFNVQLATAHQLLKDGHEATFLSGDSFGRHVRSFKALHASKSWRENLKYVSLGNARSVEDFTPSVRHLLPHMRRRPGDPHSIQTCVRIGHVSWKEHKATAKRVRKCLEELDPDMIIVDVLSPAMITGVRLTKRNFFLTIPCSPGLTTAVKGSSPHPVARFRAGCAMTSMENAYLQVRDCAFLLQKPALLGKWWRMQRQLGLKSFGLLKDTTLLPPYWLDDNCLGGIHFNAAGLNDCPNQSASLFFVGAGITPPEEEEQELLESAIKTVSPSSVEGWLDQALSFNQDVIYVNMGSMFIWEAREFDNIMQAFEDVYHAKNGNVRFLFKAPTTTTSAVQLEKRTIPSYVRICNWIDDQHAVYSHPALRIFVHHGGGNSFNEAVYYGVPQIVSSQWLDTHEYGMLVEQFGLGMHSKCPPYIRTRDITSNLLALLEPAAWSKAKAASTSWSIRSRLGGGPVTAAKLLISRTEEMEKLLRIMAIDSAAFTPLRSDSSLLKDRRPSATPTLVAEEMIEKLEKEQ